VAGNDDLNVSLKITGDASSLHSAAEQAQADLGKIGQAAQQSNALARDTARYLSSEAKSLEEVTERRHAYGEALKSGVLSADQFFVASKQLATQEQALKSGLLEAAGAVSHFNLNTSAARVEIGRLVKDLATDQPQRFAQSFTTLASQTGVLGSAMKLLVSPIGLVTAAVVAAAGIYIHFAAQNDTLTKSLAATGNYAAADAQQLKALGAEAEQSDGHIRGTADAVTQLAETGKFAGSSLQLAGQGAAAFANLTGTSLEKAIGLFEKLRDAPLKTLAELDQHYHFLSVDQIEQISQLEQMGDKARASSEAIKIFADAMISRNEEVKKDLSEWGRLMDAIATSAANAESRVKGFLASLVNGKYNAQHSLGVFGLLLPGTTSFSNELVSSATGTNGHQFDSVVGGSSSSAAAATNEASQAQAKFNSYLAQTQVAVDKEVVSMQHHIDAMNQSKEAIALENQNRAVEQAYLAKGAPLTDAETAAIERQNAPLIALARNEDQAAAAKKGRAAAEHALATARREAATDAIKLDDVIGKLTEDTAPLAKITDEYNKQLDFLAAAETHFHDAGELTAEVLEKLQKAYDLLNQRKQEAIEKQQILNQLHDEEGSAIDNLLQKYTDEERSLTDLSESWHREQAEATAAKEADRAWAQAVREALRDGDQARAQSLLGQKGYYEQLARFHADEIERLKQERSLIDSWAQAGEQDMQQFFQSVNQGGSVMKNLVNLTKQVVQQIIFEFEKLAIINPLLNAIFGGNRPGLSTAGGALGMLFNGGGGGSGGGVGSAGGGTGTFSLFSPSSWIDAGKNLYNGFSSLFTGGTPAGAMSGGGGTLVDYGMSSSNSGTLLNYGAGGAVGPGAVSPGFWGSGMSSYGGVMGVAGGIYAGYNAYNAAGGGIGGLAAGAAYGVGTSVLAGAAGTAMASGLSAGLAAIPVVGWIALAAMFVNMISGGKLFGTAWKTKTAGVDLNIGPDGGTAHTWEYQQKQGALFSGMKDRTKNVASSPEAIKAAQDFFDSIKQTMTSAAKALEIEVPPVIEASLQTVNEYDKKGHLKSTKYLVEAFGQHWEEASADLAAKRIQADAIIDVISHTDVGKDAIAIAAQFQGSADLLADAAAMMVQATADIQSKHGLLGLSATLSDTVDVVQQYQQGSESLVQTYGRLQQEVAVMKEGIDVMGIAAGKAGADLVKFADDFVQAAGGVQAAAQLQQSFEQAYYSPKEIAQSHADALHAQLGGDLTSIGLGADTTMAQFRDAFDAIKDSLNGADLAHWEQVGNELAQYFTLINQINADQAKKFQDWNASFATLVQNTQQIAAQLFGTGADQIQAKIDALMAFGNETGIWDFRQITALKKQIKDQQDQQQHAQQLAGANALLGNIGSLGVLTGETLEELAKQFNIPLDKLAGILGTDQAGLAAQFQQSEDIARATLDTSQNTKYTNELLADILAQQQGLALPYSLKDLQTAHDGTSPTTGTTTKPTPIGGRPPSRGGAQPGQVATDTPTDRIAAVTVGTKPVVDATKQGTDRVVAAIEAHTDVMRRFLGIPNDGPRNTRGYYNSHGIYTRPLAR
jgi:phage-related minor tail protein